jgi:hypothetical protein
MLNDLTSIALMLIIVGIVAYVVIDWIVFQVGCYRGNKMKPWQRRAMLEDRDKRQQGFPIEPKKPS